MQNSAHPMKDFTSYLNQLEAQDILRFITCGSVDDGKSTLIGRLLFETGFLHDDQLTALQADSAKYGTTQSTLDYALLLDGLSAEREQGITIDVAYRFFSTNKRKFIVADTPGHEQYTRNMATGASSADAALVMLDASKGILPQTRRHSIIVSMFGVKKVILVVNKMDLVNYQQSIFEGIKSNYLAFAKELGIESVEVIPVSAVNGDNVTTRSTKMPWYDGSALLPLLETIKIDVSEQKAPFRMPVQWVNRPDANFRGFAGRIVSGEVKPQDRVRILPGGQETTIQRIVTFDGDLDCAQYGQSVTCTFQDEIDASRGSLIVDAKAPCEVADKFEASLLWLHEKPMISGREYRFKSNVNQGFCTPSMPKYRLDVNTLNQESAKQLAMNEVGVCEIVLNEPIPFEKYTQNRALGSFILIDRMTNETVAAGLIHFALMRATNVQAQALLVDKAMRTQIKAQKPVVLWFTGLSGAGKSTIANLVEERLNAAGKHTMLLDGDNIRLGLNRDLGFTESARAENIRRVAEVSKLMTDAGLITIVALISPYSADRKMARELIGQDEFLEIHIDAPIKTLQARDTKGLYKKAHAGEIKNFTGITSPYEEPSAPDLKIDTEKLTPTEATELVLSLLYDKRVI